MSDKWYPGKNLGFKKKPSKSEAEVSKANSKTLNEDNRQVSEDNSSRVDFNGDLMMSVRRGKM